MVERRQKLRSWPVAIAITVFILVGFPVIGALGVISFFKPEFVPSYIPGTDAYAKRQQDIKRNEAVATRNEEIRKKNAKIAAEHGEYRALCLLTIKSQVRFPTKINELDFYTAEIGYLITDKNVTTVRGRTDLMNGLGLTVPHTFGCDIKDGVVVNAAVSPG